MICALVIFCKVTSASYFCSRSISESRPFYCALYLIKWTPLQVNIASCTDPECVQLDEEAEKIFKRR
jgi:hypothetical protein